MAQLASEKSDAAKSNEFIEEPIELGNSGEIIEEPIKAVNQNNCRRARRQLTRSDF